MVDLVEKVYIHTSVGALLQNLIIQDGAGFEGITSTRQEEAIAFSRIRLASYVLYIRRLIKT